MARNTGHDSNWAFSSWCSLQQMSTTINSGFHKPLTMNFMSIVLRNKILHKTKDKGIVIPSASRIIARKISSLEILFLIIRLTHVTPELLTGYGNSEINNDKLCALDWNIC